MEFTQLHTKSCVRMEGMGNVGAAKGVLIEFSAYLTLPMVPVRDFDILLQLGRSVTMIPYASYHLHILVMATFASLVAPFGGFFASGFKRAFNIKDFGDSIPGHGGMTDRMDCQ